MHLLLPLQIEMLLPQNHLQNELSITMNIWYFYYN